MSWPPVYGHGHGRLVCGGRAGRHYNSGHPVNAAGTMGLLIGDVDATGRVDGNDVSGVQSRTRQTTDGTNYRYDVDFSGRIDGNDVSETQGHTRTALPSHP